MNFFIYCVFEKNYQGYNREPVSSINQKILYVLWDLLTKKNQNSQCYVHFSKFEIFV